MRYLLIILLLVLESQSHAQAIEQRCEGDDCIQIGKNIGTINIEGRMLQIGINEGIVTIIGSPSDKAKIKDYKTKVANLESQINRHLEKIQKQEKRRFGDQEKLQKATDYTASLLKQIDQLGQRIARLDEQHELTQRIKAAKDNYDVPLIKALLKEKQQREDKQAAETAFELAGFQQLDLEYKDAYKNYKKAVFLQENNSTYLNGAGLVAITLADFKNAIHLFEKALASDLKNFGEDHPDVARDRNNLGTAWDALGQYEKAITYFELALASDLKTYGEDHPDVATDRNSLGAAWYALGKYKKAIEYYELALATFEKALGVDHPNTIKVAKNLTRAQTAR